MPYTLEDLLAVPTPDAVRDEIRTALTGAGVPLSATRYETVSLLVSRVAQSVVAVRDLLATITAGGFLDLAADLEQPLWLTLLAEGHYRLTRTPAQAAVVSVRLTSGAAGPYSIAPGTALLASATGRRYTSTNTVAKTLAANSTLDLTFRAESPGADYNLVAGAALALVQSLPGVVATTRPTISDTVCSQAGQPAVTGSGTPSAAHSFVLVIDVGGTRGTATVKISTNNGVSFAGAVTTAATHGPYDGTTLNLAAGTYTAGAVYRLSAGLDPIVLPGVPEESNVQLAQRCRDRWPLLAAGRWTVDGVAALARAAVPGILTSVVVDATNPDGPGTARAYCAQLGGGASLGVVALVQSALTQNQVFGSSLGAYAASAVNVEVHMQITCTTGTKTTGLAEFKRRMTLLQGAIQINGTVQLSDLVERTRSIPGVRNVIVSAPVSDYTATGFEIPALTFGPSTGIPTGGDFDTTFVVFTEV